MSALLPQNRKRIRERVTDLVKVLFRSTLIPLLAPSALPSLLRWLRKKWPKKSPSILILTYHRICIPQTPFLYQSETLGVAPDRFACQLDYLTAHYSVISLPQALDRLESSGTMMEENIVITFDDGYRDNLQNALPILEQYQIPATVFLATDFISDHPALMWNDRLSTLLEEADPIKLRAQASQFPNPQMMETFISYPYLTVADKQHVINQLTEGLKTLTNSVKDQVLDLLDSCRDTFRATPGSSERIMLSWSEALALQMAGIELGAHTCSHPVLSRVSLTEATSEIIESGKMITEHVGVPCETFAFPNGQPTDIPINSTESLMIGGYRCACTTTAGINHPGVDRFRLKRVSVSNLSANEFSLFIEYWFIKDWICSWGQP